MLARVLSCAVIGLDGVVVEVEVASGQVPPESIEDTLVLGELSLDGGVRHVRGVYITNCLDVHEIEDIEQLEKLGAPNH